jgi:hypothetical protein
VLSVFVVYFPSSERGYVHFETEISVKKTIMPTMHSDSSQALYPPANDRIHFLKVCHENEVRSEENAFNYCSINGL